MSLISLIKGVAKPKNLPIASKPQKLSTDLNLGKIGSGVNSKSKWTGKLNTKPTISGVLTGSVLAIEGYQLADMLASVDISKVDESGDTWLGTISEFFNGDDPGDSVKNDVKSIIDIVSVNIWAHVLRKDFASARDYLLFQKLCRDDFGAAVLIQSIMKRPLNRAVWIATQ